jgi:hypothetical protein
MHGRGISAARTQRQHPLPCALPSSAASGPSPSPSAPLPPLGTVAGAPFLASSLGCCGCFFSLSFFFPSVPAGAGAGAGAEADAGSAAAAGCTAAVAGVASATAEPLAVAAGAAAGTADGAGAGASAAASTSMAMGGSCGRATPTVCCTRSYQRVRLATSSRCFLLRPLWPPSPPPQRRQCQLTCACATHAMIGPCSCGGSPTRRRRPG